ncbi:Kae1-like domain-containing protein [Propionispora hippei]|uniref:N(6)-L-threonylcarbamoyladenine synthase n=1 Tax=Propionispora hippei DSM 15287 TaxID=1123003 RepID=A0A1M6B084_9FIRM|nr:O-sialoglycoprotein endopeptidase [Propionispora hippei]SHI42130.1 N6-L-threonylcarbamoyladenine synthase [Propionispora hippei DSM 15287]
MTRCYLGIDTSCYTTSVAIFNETGHLLTEVRKLLTVKFGGRGLAQSEMVFQHSRNLPLLLEQALASIQNERSFAAIGVSAYPRPLPDSYMPAFLVGEGYARALACMQNNRLYRISHQENHILAGIWSAGGPAGNDFLAVHVSGGTTEIVRVSKTSPMSLERLGGSSDLHAGQFIDRVGVAMKLPFPAGPHLEKLAAQGHDNPLLLPVAARGLQISFSGPESHVMRLLPKNPDFAALAAGVEICVAEALYKMIREAIGQTGLEEILLVGGVMSNSFIRQYVSKKLTAERAKLYFPQKEFSSDNAVGAAYFASIQ